MQQKYSLGSFVEPIEDVQTGEHIWRYISGKKLSQIFTEIHANLIKLIEVLMQTRGTRFIVEETLCDRQTIFHTFSGCSDTKFYYIEAEELCTCSYVQQATIAALQILYHTSGTCSYTDTYVVLNSSDLCSTRIRIYFKFQGYFINFTITEDASTSYISLYTSD